MKGSTRLALKRMVRVAQFAQVKDNQQSFARLTRNIVI